MALTMTLNPGRSVVDKCGLGLKMIGGSLAFDGDYPTGGEALDLSKIFPTKVQVVLIECTGGYAFSFDYVNNKVLAYTGALAQAADHANLAALSDVRFVAFGM